MSRIGRLAAGQRFDDQQPDGFRKLGEKISRGHMLVKRGTSLPKFDPPRDVAQSYCNKSEVPTADDHVVCIINNNSAATQHQLHLHGRNTQQRPSQTKENKDNHINKTPLLVLL